MSTEVTKDSNYIEGKQQQQQQVLSELEFIPINTNNHIQQCHSCRRLEVILDVRFVGEYHLHVSEY